MESSSKIYGDGTEECQSSESGWTMYIGSSMGDDDDDDDDDVDDDGGGGAGALYDGDGGRKKGSLKDEDEDISDDSMASDASSGPNHLNLQQPWEVDNKLEKHKCLSKKNSKKTSAGKIKKVGYNYEESSRKKDESLVNEKRGVINTVQSGNRANWFLSKRK